MVRQIVGAGFAFVPRSLVMQPAAFGHVPDLLPPKDPADRNTERYRAAMMQHLMCFAARTAVRKEFGTSPSLHVRASDQQGLGEDRVRRVFRGATMAQFTDFAFWVANFPEVGQVVSEYIASWSLALPREPTASVSQQSEPEVTPAVTPSTPRSVVTGPPMSSFQLDALRRGNAPARRRTTPQNPHG